MAPRAFFVIVGICLGLTQPGLAYELTLYDPAGDDYGPGSYIYPLDPVFTAGSFDITQVSVREAGSRVSFEVQIAGEIEDPWGSGAGFSLQSVDIYIDQDGIPGLGSTTGLERRNVEFASSSGWEYVIWCAPPFDGFQTHVIDAYGNQYYSGISVNVDQSDDVLIIEVPKTIIGTPHEDWKYVVLMLSQNGYQPGRVRPVMEEVGQWVLGGGDDSSWDSNVIDMAAQTGVNQEALLANYNPLTGVHPILVNRVDSASPAIEHSPATSWEAHLPLPVDAEIEDDVVVEASLWVRQPNEEFEQFYMDRVTATLWQATIPGSRIEVEGLEYFLWATDGTNSSMEPDSATPFTVEITADVTPPSIENIEGFPARFSPNGDGYKDSTLLNVELSEPGYLWLDVYDSLDTRVRVLLDSSFAENLGSVAWDGRDGSGEGVGDGTYSVIARCRDLADHPGTPETTWVEVANDMAARRLDVILLFHANQNLVPYGKVADRACYRGVLSTLRAHPSLKFVIHFSGSLISDLLWFDPQTLEILRQGVQDGQFEIAGSTYIQNIIYSTRASEDDFQFNHHQIALHRELIQSVFGVAPVSFWNPERVWTQTIVRLLADQGYQNVQVEDHILFESGITGSEYAVRTTTYQGRSVYVFDDDKTFEGLVNGAIDSGDTSTVMAFLNSLYEEDTDDQYAVCYHEDMEATGLWDYEGGEDPAVDLANLDKLLTALENDPRIRVTTYSEFLQDHQPLEDISPLVDGAAEWMGRDAWFAENAAPEAQAYRDFFDSIRDTINAIHSTFGGFGPDTVSARSLIDHAWLTLCAHQYEFAVHGYGGIVGTTQWDLARDALVAARAARYALAGAQGVWAEDLNDDGIEEIAAATGGDLFVLSPYGGRLLYWFDLEDGAELVGNENFMRSYGEAYTHDNAYVPIAVGAEAYPWLTGNQIIPEVHQWTFEARRRCFNDSIWIDGGSSGSTVYSLLDYDLDTTGVQFYYDLGEITIIKRISPSIHSLDLEYAFYSSSSQTVDIRLEVENGLSPDCAEVIMTGRDALRYWDGEDTSSVLTGSMHGVVNVLSGKGLLFEFTTSPTVVTGEEDVFGLEVNPHWDFEIPPHGQEWVTVGVTLASFSEVDPAGWRNPVGRLLVFPNPSRGKVRFHLGADPASAVSAAVFDASGRLVCILDGVGAASGYSMSWDGRNRYGRPVASGVYVIRVMSGKSATCGKVNIVR